MFLPCKVRARALGCSQNGGLLWTSSTVKPIRNVGTCYETVSNYCKLLIFNDLGLICRCFFVGFLSTLAGGMIEMDFVNSIFKLHIINALCVLVGVF